MRERRAMYGAAMTKLLRREALTEAEASAVMEEVMDAHLSPVRIAAFLTALAAKGETAEELAGLAAVMRARASRVDAGDDLLDTCGTGGSGLSTPNTSTIAAFILAAGGVRIAKHGNRAQSGRCGSMDVLEALGVPFDLGPAEVSGLIAETGIGFMFAPRFHPAMAHAGAVRRELGFRTTFNFLGPLANPAGAAYQVLGVSDRRRARPMVDALARLGARRVFVVHGSDGLDEITLSGPTHVLELSEGQVTEWTFDPASVGLEPVDPSRLTGGDASANAELFRSVLEGRDQGPVRDLAAVNAAAGFVVTGRARSMAAGLALAQDTLASGAALRTFERHRDAARRAQKATP